MPRTCTVCKHPDRKAIDKALVDGVATRTLAARYGPLTRTSIQRHQEDHLPQKLAKAKAAKEVSHADDLLSQVKALQGKATSLLLKAEADGDYKTALAGIQQARGCIELLAKLLGEINDGTTVNVIISPEWLQVRAVIVSALSEHPQARQAVAQALSALEAQP